MPLPIAPVEGKSALVAAPDPEARVLIAFMLRRLGFEVAEARGALDAVAVSDAHTGEFDLLVSNALMPRMDGIHLAERLRERRPGLRVLLVADDSYSRSARKAAAQKGLRFLRRPFTLAMLASAVRDTLDAPLTMAAGRA